MPRVPFFLSFITVKVEPSRLDDSSFPLTGDHSAKERNKNMPNYKINRLVKGQTRYGIFQNLAHPSEYIGYIDIHFAGYLFGINWRRW